MRNYQKKSRTPEQKAAQTKAAREARARPYPLTEWIRQEFSIGMMDGRWSNRIAAAVELTKQANSIAWCFSFSSRYGPARDYSAPVQNYSDRILNAGSKTQSQHRYSRKLYLSLAEVEKSLELHGITYPKKLGKNRGEMR